VNEVRLDLGWIAQAVAGRLRTGDPGREVGGVVTDSRTVKPGDLFVALKGPRFDGHTFVPEVMARGAAGVMVEPGWEERADSRPGLAMQTRHADAGVIEVADALKALQDLANAIRRAAGTRVIAITGSAGKTTTKEAIAALLATRLRVVKNKGNLNNHIGLPISLVELRTRPDVAVMELGMNHAGEISTLVAIAEPDVRVWTNVGDAHLGFFASPDAIADAKSEILERANADTLLVCNADDSRIAARIHAFAGRTVTFGASATADVAARDIEDLGLQGMRARVVTRAGERVIQTSLLGRGNLSNVLAATAVALEFGIHLDEVAAAVATLRPADRRGAVQRLRDGIVLVDDSYNSSPSALKRSLEAIAYEAGAARKVAVLGEMLELGAHSEALHRECGRAAAAAGIGRLFVVGGAPARSLRDAAVDAGMPASSVTHFETSDEAAPAVVAAIRPGDLVLVKGSRGIRTDIVADRLSSELG
jgi:UDP-N-acetylmuramoyl-tripeptide--D-alanyl-D-alanine ligase